MLLAAVEVVVKGMPALLQIRCHCGVLPLAWLPHSRCHQRRGWGAGTTLPAARGKVFSTWASEDLRRVALRVSS